MRLERNWGAIDEKGTLIIPINYSDITAYSEGVIGVQLNKKWGFLDRNGKTVIPFIYNDIDPYFKNHKIGVVQNGRSFYIDNKGNEVK